MTKSDKTHPAVCLVLATRNRHKADEIRAILSDQFRYLTLNDLSGAPSIVEDANTFAGNATKKATTLAHWLAENLKREPGISETFVLADDSGLEVDVLDGAPGVNSARFAALDSGAEGNSSDAANNEKLLRLLKDVPATKRTARFRCVLALTPVGALSRQHDPVVTAIRDQTQLFEDVCEGRIATVPRGETGFGYDPFFIPNGYEQSFAELGEPVKNQISHRALALTKLRQWFINLRI